MKSNKTIMNEQELYEWIQKQKKDYHEGILTGEQIKKLESLNGWSWD